MFVACSGVTVGVETPNDFIANDIGILVDYENGNTGTPIINYNNIEGNGVGLQNNAPDTVDAKNNWWGDRGGPGADDDGDGVYGDLVVGNVDYEPWLYEPLY